MWEHDEVVTRKGRRSGLAVTVAVHSRALGPAAGGCRLRHYARWQDAQTDAMRLSRAMTHKNALAGLPFGGGKSVIAVPADAELTPALRLAALEDLGELIATFDGSYIAGPDIGTGPDDMLVLRRSTPHVFCLPASHGGIGPSGKPTAIGVLAALRAAARHVFGDASMSGRTVVVIGLGSVGLHLVEHLAAAGARVIASDVDEGKRRFAQERGFGWVEPSDALRVSADVIIPAAVGGLLNPDTVADLDAALVVGPANNQLSDDSVAELLARRGVVWVPDVVASAGGAIYTLLREVDGVDHATATARVEAIEDTVDRVLVTALTAGTTPLHEATSLLRARLAGATGESRVSAR